MKQIMKHFKEPVFGMGFDLYIGVERKAMTDKYKGSFIHNAKYRPEAEGRSLSDEENRYYVIRLQHKDLPLFIHELLHCLHFQLKSYGLGLGKDLELLAYISQYFVEKVLPLFK